APTLPADASSTTVDVRNASGAPGAAAAESRALAALGYTPGRIANAPAATATTVTHGTGADAAARHIAARLGADPVPDPSLPARHVVVTLGSAPRTPGPPGDTSARPVVPDASGRMPDDAFHGRPVRMGGVTCVD
ncbi:LytR C-terminal domain-containing protein, partial [Streptomyces sp. URMC 126]|uniref:LytR C-terminal domain-containing protein n=1 Tax=Streptomyces sp. URMC 126 TaxID=3423401 RepID=UPI003F1CFAFD